MPARLVDNRAPAVAGAFYPAESAVLRQDVRRYLSAAKPRALGGELRAILVPHAGYSYSGQVAAEAFRQLAGDWQTVILLGPSHREAVRGASVWASGSFSTPLGEVSVDETLVRELLEACDLFEDSRSPHRAEHSLEVELPFLQETLKSFRMVPILMNTGDLDKCRQIGQAIASVIARRHSPRPLGRNPSLNLVGPPPVTAGNDEQKSAGGNDGRGVLLVISSDLSHYPDQETARRADRTSLLALEQMDPEFLKRTSEILLEGGYPELHCTFCGEAALLAGLEALKTLGADKVELLQYANSAYVPQGDPDRVVGYAAAAFMKRNPSPYPLPKGRGATLGEEMSAFSLQGEGGRRPDEGLHEMSLAAQKELVDAARTSIEEGLQKKALRMGPLSDDPVLNLPLNVFVTLWLDGELQGCIGSLQPRETLLEAVRRLARDSAFDDPRGTPLGPADLARLKIEISILSPFQRVPDAAVIEIGKHGVLLSKGSRRGLFLPDVWEHFSRKEDFLDALCEQKMGLPRRSWQDPGMVFDLFTTQKIQES